MADGRKRLKGKAAPLRTHGKFARGKSHTRDAAKSRLAGKDGFANRSRVSKLPMAGNAGFAKRDGIVRRVCKEMWRRTPGLQKFLASNDGFARRNPPKPLQTRRCPPSEASFRRHNAKLSAAQRKIFGPQRKSGMGRDSAPSRLLASCRQETMPPAYFSSASFTAEMCIGFRM